MRVNLGKICDLRLKYACGSREPTKIFFNDVVSEHNKKELLFLSESILPLKVRKELKELCGDL